MSESTRPLSPHLQVYRPQLTSVTSILHRITGVLLAVGSIALASWVLAVAAGPEALATFNGYAGSWLGQLLLLGWAFAMFYHLSNGIRHLFWDAGMGFELDAAYRSGYAAIASAVVLTIIAAVIALV